MLGENVRYDGSNKLDRYLKSKLGKYINFVPVCPETECGLSVPREPMHIEYDGRSFQLLGNSTRTDHTEKFYKWTVKKLNELKKMPLDGFIFKSRSPSCGVWDVKIYDSYGRSLRKGKGIFVNEFTKKIPTIPVEDSDHLANKETLIHFLEKVFLLWRFHEMMRSDFSAKQLINFHSSAKLALMAHSPEIMRKMGNIVANLKKEKFKKILALYEKKLFECINSETTTGRHVNVLQHTLGYFRNLLKREEKQQAETMINKYKEGEISLFKVLQLMYKFAVKYNVSYLAKQFYLNPFPMGLIRKN